MYLVRDTYFGKTIEHLMTMMYFFQPILAVIRDYSRGRLVYICICRYVATVLNAVSVGHLLYLFRAILSSDAKTRALLGTNVCALTFVQLFKSRALSYNNVHYTLCVVTGFEF